MTEPDHDYAGELRPYVDRPESEAINEVAGRLAEGRALPHAGFRAELKAELLEAESRGSSGWRPKHVGAAIAAYASSGIGLLVVAALTSGAL